MSYVLNVRNCFSLERMQRLTRCYFYSEGIYSLVAEYHSMLMSPLPKKGGGHGRERERNKRAKSSLEKYSFHNYLANKDLQTPSPPISIIDALWK